MKILIIPDTQVKYGEDFNFLSCIGRYIVKKQPDVIVHLGDFVDMESLSSYDVGKKSFEGRRYVKDISAATSAMESLLGPLYEYNRNAKRSKRKMYIPRMVLTLGNHEYRIQRAIEQDAKLEGLIKYEDLPYQNWEVVPYLTPIIISGVAFCHYYTSGVLGRPISTAQLLVNKLHMSCVAGHQQGKQIAYGKRVDGKGITCMIVGSCYEHDESYMDPQSNNCWKGIVMLHEVNDGQFDEMFISLNYLKEKYG